MTSFPRLESIIQYKGRAFSLQTDLCQLPNGDVAPFDFIQHPGGAAIVPVASDGTILFVRQYRPAVQSVLLELPAGTRSGNEPLHETAQRELREETGHRGTIEQLGSFYLAPGYSSEFLHLFVATDLESDPLPQDSDEAIELHPLSLEQALHAIQTGAIQDAKTIAGVLLYQHWAQQRAT